MRSSQSGGTTVAGPARRLVVPALGVTQILAWGSTYYLPAVIAPAIAADTAWPLPAVVGGLTLGLLVAGAVSPLVGRTIDRHGGRPVLCAASLLFAAGLAALAAAPSLFLYLAAWALLGLAMGAGLYDAAFATLGRIFGETARPAITCLTLIAGFASTVSWPLTAWLAAGFGWRGACLAYAALQLLVALPLHACVLPRRPAAPAPTARDATPGEPAGRAPPRLYLLLAVTITLAAAITAVVAVHLLSILQGRGLGLAAAVGLGALIGPSQVAARAVEMAVGRRRHPIWSMVAATMLVATGVGLLALAAPLAAVALVCFGAGAGIHSIARGTVPLALFGPAGYPTLLGRLARPSLVAQALAPVLAAELLQATGPGGTLAALLVAAAADVGLALALVVAMRAAYAPLSRQTTSPTSSATSSDAPSGPTATPTGRP